MILIGKLFMLAQEHALAEKMQSYDYAQLHSPTYSGGLANHLPMALTALQTIGASQQEQWQFIEIYKHKLEPVAEHEAELNSSNWIVHLGSRCHYQTYQRYFLRQLQQVGLKEVLHDHFDILVRGVCASAFHCIIRLGLGLKMQNQNEIACALAFFASEYQPLGNIAFAPQRSQKITVDEIAKILQQSLQLTSVSFNAPNIFERLDKVSQQPEFCVLTNKLSTLEISLSNLADFNLRLFACTQDFTALHAVTSCHAMRYVYPFIEHKTQALSYYAQAILAAYISIGLPKVRNWTEIFFKPQHAPTWKTLFKMAIASNNDHKIKMVFSCFEEGLHYQDQQARYRGCAQLALDSDV